MTGRIELSRIYGKIQLVDRLPDFKVQVVRAYGDLQVQLVDRFPKTSGKWQMVKEFPDFKIKLVDHFADFTIQYVIAHPGVRR